MVVPWPKSCGANLLLESVPLSYALRGSQAAFNLQRERLRLIAPLEHKVYALVVNKARPCIELAVASQDAECSDQVLYGLSLPASVGVDGTFTGGHCSLSRPDRPRPRAVASRWGCPHVFRSALPVHVPARYRNPRVGDHRQSKDSSLSSDVFLGEPCSAAKAVSSTF